MSVVLESTHDKNFNVSDGQSLQLEQLQEVITLINTVSIAKSQRFQYMVWLREISIILDCKKVGTPLYSKIIHSMLTIAKLLCDWPLIIFIQKNLIKTHQKKSLLEKFFDALLLGEAYFQLGLFNLSMQVLESQLLYDPKNTKLYHCRHAVMEKLQKPRISEQGRGGNNEIYLTPLQAYHLESFSWQYSQSVMELCNLCDFRCDDEWLGWFDDMQQEMSRTLFAVVHREWGIIGCVSLQVFDGIGFFYYWLGEDFQACGFGPKAVNLLLDYGYCTMEMNCCYAKVYQHNIPSHKAIKKLGFEMLPFSALPPYENEVFYYLGNKRTNSVLFMELRRLLRYMDSALDILPNQCFNKNKPA
ncbi:hypothetical protein AB835_00490 [Candidatus Endobugula sertula]|uniref:N-acetyltransferase domain-containing protein n=1 Tax=Candidatus Endobugula sertula TaxID=62101 RepID=A0A1D2QTX3_9GAMM|nr:hypothetical protein AB835_00490 [Candidatus Endobugula sertula]